MVIYCNRSNFYETRYASQGGLNDVTIKSHHYKKTANSSLSKHTTKYRKYLQAYNLNKYKKTCLEILIPTHNPHRLHLWSTAPLVQFVRVSQKSLATHTMPLPPRIKKVFPDPGNNLTSQTQHKVNGMLPTLLPKLVLRP
jgi:hypothetical protein